MQEIFKNGSTISYGKRKNLAPGIVEDYLILPDSTKGFTSDEKNNFEKICKSFSWTSTSNPGEILPPCYGFFPFGDGSSILVARFIDDGRDNQGRADLLRVDAIKIPAQLFHELKSDLSFVFDSSIWKNTFAIENSMADSIVISPDDCDKVFELVKKSITVPLLVGCSKNFKFKPTSGKFNSFDINSKTVEEISVPIVAPPSNPRIPLPPQKPIQSSVVQKYFPYVVFLSLIGNIFFGLLAYDLKFNQIEKLEIEKKEKDEKITYSDNLVIEKDGLIKEKDVIIAQKIADLNAEKNKTKFDLDKIMEQVKSNPTLVNAKKVLEKYEIEAHDAFMDRVKSDFSKAQKKSIDKWLEDLKASDSKGKK
ncbi:MAG: hypothetical protein NTV50_14630 [Planctomycetota bacterium]|nr:hypothetical protein [Planctomycetota bacterium]